MKVMKLNQSPAPNLIVMLNVELTNQTSHIWKWGEGQADFRLMSETGRRQEKD